MRVFAIIFTAIVCLGLMSIENVYGLPFVSPEYSYDTAKHVIVGRVISVEFLKDPNSQYFDQKYGEMAGLALYEIQVEEYMKNPMENPTIQVLGRYIDQKQTLYYESFHYEINQRVLLYLKTSDIPQYDLMIDPRGSRAISEDFSAKQMLEDLKNKSAPLQQIKFGFSINEIVCKNNLILIQKYDGSPACVMESTKTKLIERGWTGLTSTIKESLLKRSSNLPEVIAFYETYPDAEASIKNDHVSYFAGNDKGYFVRMNLMFDKNYSIADIDFHCYYQRVHQYELPQEDIVSKIVNYDCEEHGKTVMGE